MLDAAADDLPAGVRTVILGVCDLNGILRGKRVAAAHWPHVQAHGVALENLVFALDIGSHRIPNAWTGHHTGSPDVHLRPVGPLRPVPWEDGVMFALGEAREASGAPSPLDPRPALLRVLAKAHAMGLEISLGAELEFYLYDPATLRPVESRHDCYGLDRAADMEHVLAPIRDGLTAMGIPIEQSNPEFAPGQVEVNIRHAPAREAVEHALILRGMVKQIARRHGLRATFMPKPYADRSGSGFHMHHSARIAGRPAFADGGRISALGRAYLAGMQRRLPETALVGAPLPNSYRRRTPYSYAPTVAAWGYDNRSVALRVIEGDDSAVRIEAREAGADANPWLLAAVQIAAGLEGVAEGLSPDAPVEGDGYAATGRAPIPCTMRDALEAARGSAFLHAVLGPHLVGLLITQAEQEQARVDAEITATETGRYLETM
ncbi:MAG: glutamine synthetase [Paracoccaceae bacterium]|jgi:glutamine synthetase